MTYRWGYPVYLVRLGGGYAAVKTDTDADPPPFAVVVFSSESRCQDFADSMELDGEIVKLNNDREFAALVSLLKPPFTSVVFDSTPEGTQVNADWEVDVATLLADHLPLARSPWDYPLFALRETEGYTSIRGDREGGESFVAVGLFTRRELAESFIKGADIRAAVIQLDDPHQLGELLAGLTAAVTAAAFNPAADGAKRSAKHCVRISDIKAKYLPGRQ